uniref:Uncharacterized protein n=1 Tax=Anopheles melas TaxID=34690 RepID=A0A182U8F9_9DIPT
MGRFTALFGIESSAVISTVVDNLPDTVSINPRVLSTDVSITARFFLAFLVSGLIKSKINNLMLVLRLILMMLGLRCLVSLDRLTVHLRDESALALNVVRDGTLVTVGIDQ